MKSKYPALVLIILAAAAAVVILLAPKEGRTAKIYLDGELLASVELDRAAEPYTVEAGEGNTVQVEKGRVRMLHADCPDQLCVDMGWTSSPLKPVVCLPNRVMIIIEGRAEADVVAG